VKIATQPSKSQFYNPIDFHCKINLVETDDYATQKRKEAAEAEKEEEVVEEKSEKKKKRKSDGSSLNHKPATLNLNLEPEALQPKPEALNPQLSTLNPQPEP